MAKEVLNVRGAKQMLAMSRNYPPKMRLLLREKVLNVGGVAVVSVSQKERGAN